MRGKKKPLKSEAIHETGLSGYVVASFFPLIIFIYTHILYIYVAACPHTSVSDRLVVCA